MRVCGDVREGGCDREGVRVIRGKRKEYARAEENKDD